MVTKYEFCPDCGNRKSVTAKFCEFCYCRKYYKEKVPTLKGDLEWANCEIERLRALIKGENNER